jgi:tRNA (guanine37-N1)-methyltransferase
MRFDVLTLFPALFDGYLTQSILKLALDRGLVAIHRWDIRHYSPDTKHRKVDDRPFGGGPGMVLMCEPVVNCVEAVRKEVDDPGHLITPQGRRLTQPIVRELSEKKRLILLCGRYEGFDDRIRQLLQPDEISIGDFITSGGEVPAMVVIDAVVRYVPGVLGDEESVTEESHATPGLIEYPQYTRPRVFRGLEVPEVLLSGDHEAVAKWRAEQAKIRSARKIQ